mgnify:CR=1 FL=1
MVNKMAYTNSSMVVYTKLSPNHSGQRTMAIDRITPHCVVGQCTAEGLGEWFMNTGIQASSNYGIDKDGRVALYVEEKNRSWCSSSNANDQRAITIECASDTSEPYAFRDVVYQTLIKLCIDICKRNGKTKLLWLGDKDKTLNYSPKAGEMILTVHRWFANKSCPGNWMYARMGDLASKVTAALGGADIDVTVNLQKGDSGDAVKTMQKMLIACGYSCGSAGADGSFGENTLAAVKAFQKAAGITVDGIYGAVTKAALEKAYKGKPGTQASVLKDLSEADAIKNVGALFTADQKKTGILASLSLAQFILESGYGKSELAQEANNVFGMKCSLSGNTWSGSTWDGTSKYTKKTQEQNADGTMVTITADFRKYPCIEDSIADHSAYLLGAKNGSKFRYDGLKGCTDYKKAAQIVKDGGYATSLTYVEKLISIIEKWKLTDYDVKDSGSDTTEAIRWYRVRKSWADVSGQLGAFKILENAKKKADENPGYKVFDADGKVVYSPATSDKSSDVPFLVKVSISDLNIRKGAGTNYDRTQFIPPGIYTIVETKTGQGASLWGRLKSGAGWIALDFCSRI